MIEFDGVLLASTDFIAPLAPGALAPPGGAVLILAGQGPAGAEGDGVLQQAPTGTDDAWLALLSAGDPLSDPQTAAYTEESGDDQTGGDIIITGTKPKEPTRTWDNTGGTYDGGGGGTYDGGGGGSTGPTEPIEEIIITAPRPVANCPVNDWWPDFLEDWGDVDALTNTGPWTQFWTDGYTWCFYDDDDKLMGQFVQAETGKFSITFTGTNGNASVSGGAFGFSGGFATNDSSGVSYTIPLRRVW